VAVQAAALKASGLVVYIKRDVDYLTRRIAGDTNRPDLNASKSFAEIMQRREPYYLKAAVRAPQPSPARASAHADTVTRSHTLASTGLHACRTSS
jgi:shikimate kinase